MKVALTVNDFLRRAELIYPHRRRSSTSRTSRPSRGARSRTPRWPRGPGPRPRRSTRWASASASGSRSSATTRPACSPRCSASAAVGRVLVPINFRLVAEEVKYIVEHSGARILLVDPELDEALADVECEHRFVIGAEHDAPLEHAEPTAVGRTTRTPPRRSTTPAARRRGRRACS